MENTDALKFEELEEMEEMVSDDFVAGFAAGLGGVAAVFTIVGFAAAT
ncbi:hypothetical protein [Clostridium algidicarnis]|nr:hypothetical protein [Clostridium algidicarnis]MBU3229210.1 hypothetical protein [Clostridium algidicarnis]MBU3252724.1 hypothetical protein [Clostridium algidicarnis]